MSEPTNSTAASADDGRAVVALEIPTPFGPVLRGQRRGEGADGALLVHEPGTDLDAWGDLPARLAGDGLTVVAVDLPGHGLSDDPWRPDRLDATIRAVIDHARAAGATRLFLVAAGDAATAGLRLAAGGGLDGLVALSPTGATGEDARDLRAATLPKLILVGALDAGELGRTRALAAGCAGWTVLSTIPAAEQGTRLLAGDWGGQVGEQIVAFLRDCRRPHPLVAVRRAPPAGANRERP